MQDKTIMYKLTHGMYILTTVGGGCFVDAVSQVSSSEEPLVAVAVMKKNKTNELLHNNKNFAISIFGKDDDTELIKRFGFNSSRDMDKFLGLSYKEIDGVKIIDSTIGYLYCEIVDMIENETHTLFIAKVKDGVKNNNSEAMSYGYYQEHKEELLKVKTEKGQTAWICMLCGYVYYGEELPLDFTCPMCGAPKEMFEKKN